MILAIDYGSKRIGLATGEESLKIAFPRTVINNSSTEKAAQEICGFCRENEISKIIIGLPLNNPNYPENPILKEQKIFEEHLLKELPNLEIIHIDERFTSFQADQFIENIKEISHKRKKQKNHLGRDAYAAQAILQHYFDKT